MNLIKKKLSQNNSLFITFKNSQSFFVLSKYYYLMVERGWNIRQEER